jgi:hypothetical protein
MANYSSSLSSSSNLYQQMIDDMNAARQSASVDIAPEYGQVAEMYKTGGTYGEGLRTEAQTLAKESLSKEQADLVRTGMSSGSAAGAALSRYSRNLTGAYKNIEDTRTDKLATALSAVGAAREARGARISSVYTTTAQLLGTYNSQAAQRNADLQAAGMSAAVNVMKIKSDEANSAATLAAQAAGKKETEEFQSSEAEKQRIFDAGSAVYKGKSLYF